MDRACNQNGEGKSPFQNLTRKATGKGSLRRSIRRSEENIRMDTKAMGVNKRNWIDSVQDMDY